MCLSCLMIGFGSHVSGAHPGTPGWSRLTRFSVFLCFLSFSLILWHCYWKKVIIPQHFKHSPLTKTLLKSPPRKSCLPSHRCLWLNCISEKRKGRESCFPFFMLALSLSLSHPTPHVSLSVFLLACSTGCCQKSLGRRINCFGFNRQRSWPRQAESVH